MAPTSRLEEKLRKLGLSSDDGGSSRSTPASKPKYSFRIYFPQPPYDGVQFNALKSGAGYNFTGQLLGIGGKQLQRIKQESAAWVEVVNAEGNLNGAHPDPLDKDLHAYIVADSLSKLQRAANMVWELLQPMNARFAPIDVVPEGSARLTILQQKAASKPAMQQAAATQSVKVLKPSKPQLEHSSQGPSAAALNRPPSVSPAITPVTPAAQAGRPGSFATSSSSVQRTPSSCRSQCTSSPALHDTTTSGHSSGSNSSSGNSSSDTSKCLLMGTFDDFSLPPAAVLSAAPKQLAQDGMNSEASTPTAAAANATYASNARMVNALTAFGSTSPEQPPMQPPTPGVDSGRESVSAAANHNCLQSSMNRNSCCPTLPLGIMQDVGTAPDESLPGTAQHSIAGDAPPKGSGIESCMPLEAGQEPDQQGQQQKSVEPLANNCSSCFQYGLGLCNSTSFDSSCSCTDNPALQALLADHQRQLEKMQQLQMQQQVIGSFGSSHGRYDPMAFQSPLIGSLGGSFDSDGFSLEPPALFPSSAPMPRSQPCAPGTFGSQLHLLQEQQRMIAAAASGGTVDSFGASSMPSSLGPWYDPGPAAAGLSQPLPARRLAVNNACGSWGPAGKLPHTPMMQSSTPYGNGSFAAADQAASPWMHSQSSAQQQHGEVPQQMYRQYAHGTTGSTYGTAFDQSGLLSSIW